MHLIHQLGAGGAENGIINIVNHIDQNQIQSAICAFVGQGSQEGRVNTPQTSLFDLNKKPGNDIGLPFRLRRLLKIWQPDVLHTHAWGTLCEGVLASKMARVPVIVHGEHGTIQDKPRNRSVQRIFWSWVDQVLSVSEAHKNRLAKTIGFKLERIKVIPNGVDTARFSRQKKDPALQAALGIDPNALVIGTVGRFMPVKNQAFLVKAFAEVAAHINNIRLLLVGEGPLHDDLIALEASLKIKGRVVFAGRQSNVPAFLNLMDIFVLPSLSEGMSNTILEAMSCGCPVIATDVGGNPGIVINKKTGRLVPSEDIPALAAAIRQLIENKETRLSYGQAGRVHIEEEYSLAKMLSRYAQLYRDLFEKKWTS